MKAYEEIVDFIAARISPEDVLGFQASDAVKERVEDLIYREKTTGLSSDDKSELDQYLQLEHIMRLAKTRARVQAVVGERTGLRGK